MHLTAKLTAEELIESRRLLWAPHYKLNLVNNYIWRRNGLLHIMLIVGCGTFACPFIAGFLKINPLYIGIPAVLIAIAIFALVIVRSQNPSPKMLQSVNAQLPDFIDIEENGLRQSALDGVALFLPWSSFIGWLQGPSVCVLQPASHRDDDLVLIPLAQLSPEERLTVTSLLNQHLGPPTLTSSPPP